MTNNDIERFFRNESTLEEADKVLEHLKANPDVITQLERDWHSYEVESQLPTTYSRQIWHKIEVHITKKHNVAVAFKYLSIAAAFLVICFSVWLLINDQSAHVDTKSNLVVQASKKVFNNTVKPILIGFSDSSFAQLSPNSSLEYKNDFDSNKRVVTLKGEAFFSVGKDKSRPFMVISDSITTTVLGTKFNVKCYEFENQISVYLKEGKVSVNLSSSAPGKNMSIYYLIPGDILDYNRTTRKVSIRRASIESGASRKEASPGNQVGAAKILEGDNWFMFNNQSLQEVFSQLEKLYGVRIVYNKADVKGRSFIGKVDRSDSLISILQSIALLNQMQVSVDGNTYTFTANQ